MTAWLDEFIAGADGRVFPHLVLLAAGPRFWLSLVSRWEEVAGAKKQCSRGKLRAGKGTHQSRSSAQAYNYFLRVGE